MSFSSEQERLSDAYYAKCCNLDDGDTKIVKVVYAMIELLVNSGQAYESVIHCKSMGVHPKNRSGKRMQANTMHKKGMKIESVGFATKLSGRDKAIAFENNRTRITARNGR